jgi:hypothetical protein
MEDWFRSRSNFTFFTSCYDSGLIKKPKASHIQIILGVFPVPRIITAPGKLSKVWEAQIRLCLIGGCRAKDFTRP